MKYLELSKLLEKIESTTKRLEITKYLTEFLKNVPKDELEKVVMLLRGSVFPEWSDKVIGVADKLMIKAISLSSGASEKEVIEKWKEIGDLGHVAEYLIKNKKQTTLTSEELTVEKVFNNLKKLAEIEGKGSVEKKIFLISELLSNAKPIEARYVVRTILGILRVGVGEGAIRDSISQAFNCDKKLVERAYYLTCDYSIVAKIAAEEGDAGLKKIKMKIGTPIKVMLFLKANNMKEGFERVGRPCAIEYKYDGLRLQIHKEGDNITLYTRRLENVTKMFPEVVKHVKECVKEDCIIEGEGVGYDPNTHEFKAFQEISKRIKRKYDIEKMAKELPIVVFLFDLLYHKKSFIDKQFKERRKELEKVIEPKKWKIELAEQLITDNDKKAELFYKKALEDNQEGVMMKNLEAPYQPGTRVGYGVKIKPIEETLDLAIIGAIWGQGRRSHWLSSFILACKDGDKYLEIGKLGTGLSDKQFEEITKKLKPLIIEEKGKEVKLAPEIIVEVGYQEIQKSPTYSSGFALRFPRLIRFRPDKDEPDSLDKVKRIYESQKKK